MWRAREWVTLRKRGLHGPGERVDPTQQTGRIALNEKDRITGSSLFTKRAGPTPDWISSHWTIFG